MHTSPPLAETIASILHEQEPNILRLYLNPHVAQACLCLDRYARTTWAGGRDEDFQSFLANGIEEAISGALKLLRCNRAPTDLLHLRLSPRRNSLVRVQHPVLLSFPASARNWLSAGNSIGARL